MAALRKVTIAWAVLGGLLAGCDDSSPCRSECGDGVIACQEECDDRNRVDGDGCSADCRDEACLDQDGDGHPAETCGGDDCDDQQAGTHPGAPESLNDGGCENGLDDDCDGFTDALDLGCWPCFSDAECDDLDVCSGVETCASGACLAGEPLACDDGLFCNGAEGCDPALGCQPGALPCPAPGPCVRCREELDTCLEADGTPCDDHDGCTTSSACQAGACAPGP
ncbi:MAG TPA: DUF4215 domain-containing protein, partial [Myxococcota bacterium]|nr:DUF4215 domain-containing protein [Myxococcota bacterium]